MREHPPLHPRAQADRQTGGQTVWIISDGKAGHEVQCLGVAQALGLNAEVKRVAPGPLGQLTAPWGRSAGQRVWPPGLVGIAEHHPLRDVVGVVEHGAGGRITTAAR